MAAQAAETGLAGVGRAARPFLPYLLSVAFAPLAIALIIGMAEPESYEGLLSLDGELRASAEALYNVIHSKSPLVTAKQREAATAQLKKIEAQIANVAARIETFEE